MFLSEVKNLRHGWKKSRSFHPRQKKFWFFSSGRTIKYRLSRFYCPPGSVTPEVGTCQHFCPVRGQSTPMLVTLCNLLSIADIHWQVTTRLFFSWLMPQNWQSLFQDFKGGSSPSGSAPRCKTRVSDNIQSTLRTETIFVDNEVIKFVTEAKWDSCGNWKIEQVVV